MKLVLTGLANYPLLTFILDGAKDDGILNLSAVSRKLGCSRSSLIDRIRNYGFESAIKHFLNEKRRKQSNV